MLNVTCSIGFSKVRKSQIANVQSVYLQERLEKQREALEKEKKKEEAAAANNGAGTSGSGTPSSASAAPFPGPSGLPQPPRPAEPEYNADHLQQVEKN